MKQQFAFFFLAIGLFFTQSCTKNDTTLPAPTTNTETIAVQANALTGIVGTTITFKVMSSVNNADVTSQSRIFVNGNVITGDNYTFSQAGSFAVYASKGNISSPVISVTITSPQLNNGYVGRVLVEDFSGNWCGNCPRILFGIDSVHRVTDKVTSVGIHLSNGDPFITTQGNSLATNLGISGVPAGKINRTTDWLSPQYNNVAQVTNEIQSIANTGLGINSSLSGNTVNATIKFAYKQALTSNAKLFVYLTEDKVYATQQNYSSNLYGGLSSISNFEYKGVLRSIVSALSGDDVTNSGTTNEKMYTITLPTNISNVNNVKLVAFIVNSTGKVQNVQEAKIGVNKGLELL